MVESLVKAALIGLLMALCCLGAKWLIDNGFVFELAVFIAFFVAQLIEVLGND